MEPNKIKELLSLLEQNSRFSTQTLADLLDEPEESVQQTIEQLEREKIIVQHSTIINWDKVEDEQKVTAMIEVKITPKRDVGFDETARRISRFPEVKSVYLMSGDYDLSVMIEGNTLNEVAQFVAQKLSTLDAVVSTSSHFLLKRYKHDGVNFEDRDEDHRMVVSP